MAQTVEEDTIDRHASEESGGIAGDYEKAAFSGIT